MAVKSSPRLIDRAGNFIKIYNEYEDNFIIFKLEDLSFIDQVHCRHSEDSCGFSPAYVCNIYLSDGKEICVSNASKEKLQYMVSCLWSYLVSQSSEPQIFDPLKN